MTELQKCEQGLLYLTTEQQREKLHEKCADLCWQYNMIKPSDKNEREKIIRKIFGSLGDNPYIEPTIWCGFGFNISAGNNFFVNNNCVFVDPGKITFGNNVFIAPCCGFYTAGHPTDKKLRSENYEYAHPITVEDDVWIGGHTCILPGVTIGSGTIIGAGSTVTHSIPQGVIAVGNPCEVLRQIDKKDIEKYKPIY